MKNTRSRRRRRRRRRQRSRQKLKIHIHSLPSRVARVSFRRRDPSALSSSSPSSSPPLRTIKQERFLKDKEKQKESMKERRPKKASEKQKASNLKSEKKARSIAKEKKTGSLKKKPKERHFGQVFYDSRVPVFLQFPLKNQSPSKNCFFSILSTSLFIDCSPCVGIVTNNGDHFVKIYGRKSCFFSILSTFLFIFIRNNGIIGEGL